MKTIFFFSGQGSHYYQMGEELYRKEKHFKSWMDKLDQIPKRILGTSLVDILYNGEKKKSEPFTRTLFTHPAIFMVEYSLAQTLIAYDIAPDYLIGASLGEYVSLAVAEVMVVEELLEILILQGRAVEEKCVPGGMIGIIEPPSLFEDVEIIRNNSSLVGINHEHHFVVSGSQRGMSQIKAWLKDAGKLFQELPVSHGFHSPAIDQARDFCLDSLQTVQLHPPVIDIISCLTGNKIDSFSPTYFCDIARQPIRFQEALQTLSRTESSDFTCVDVGPSGTYAGFIKENETFIKSCSTYRIMSQFGGDQANLKSVRNTLSTQNLPDYHTKSSCKPKRMNSKIPNREKDSTMQAYIFPGQGSQAKDMGKELFKKFPDQTRQANEILGYSLEKLCCENPDNNLHKTQFTQPALFTVNALSYLDSLKNDHPKPDFVAGHSLGEYNALFAAGVIDFETGLKLVKKRGELMAATDNGGMAAVIGLQEQEVREILNHNALKQIEIANLNSPVQIVLSGDSSEIQAAQSLFEADGTTHYVILNVSGAFHSKLMEEAAKNFRQYLTNFIFSPPAIPIISNVTARPYNGNQVADLLSRQMTHPVKWQESVCYMWGKGVENFIEIGPGHVLTKLVDYIMQQAEPLKDDLPSSPCQNTGPVTLSATSLGCSKFKKEYHLKYAYITGGMLHGIASVKMLIKMGKAGMMGFFGTGSLSLDNVEHAIRSIQSQLDHGEAYGMNLLSGPMEDALVDLFLKHNITSVEAAAYLQISPALVRYRLNGLIREKDGSITITNHIIAKLSRPEIAQLFLQPAPISIIEALLKTGDITSEQAEFAGQVPMADDICVEADSGGHTDIGNLSTLLPAMISLRDQLTEKFNYHKTIRIGAAGGIGTPEAAAAAFILGADFILTGSINQCTVEAATSDHVKDMLQEINVQDTAYAPARDMFEMGTKVQVLKRGVFFPARANKLYELYRHYDSLEEIDHATRDQLEKRYFKRSFSSIYDECKQIHTPEAIKRAEQNPKQKMAMIFKWYLYKSNKYALEGKEENSIDYQVFCGPALGAFNQWVKGTDMEKWQNRHVDTIAVSLLEKTADLLSERCNTLINANR